MAAFGGSTAAQFVRTSSAGSAFPKAASPYTSGDGAIVVPHGALDRWYAYRATGCAARRDVVVWGDSTTFGSGGNYSYVQRLRDRAVSAGYPNGGKGIFAGLESAISYDSPEVNGIVVSGFGDTGDQFDPLVGSFLYDDGVPANAVLGLQFRSTAFRLWYVKRNTAADFTYSVDGGAPVTVSAQQSGGTFPRFVYVSGLAANVTHTLTVTNTGGGQLHVALAPINESGPAFQKQAVSGATFNGFFFSGQGSAPYTQPLDGSTYQAPLGLTISYAPSGSDGYAGMTVDTSYSASARTSPVLAMANLGFNDLSNVSGSTDLPQWTEYVKKFGAACRAASCDGVVISGQLPYNANWPTYGAARFQALKDTAAAQGLGFVDLFYPIGGPSLSYAGGTSNPHLTKPQYVTQADYLWDNLLGV